MFKISKVSFADDVKSFTVTVAECAENGKEYTVPDLLEEVSFKLGILFNNFEIPHSLDRMVEAGKYTVNFDGICLRNQCKAMGKRSAWLSIGEDCDIFIDVNEDESYITLNKLRTPTCYYINEKLQATMLDLVLKELCEFFNSFVRCYIDKDRLYCNGSLALLLTALYVQGIVKPDEDSDIESRFISSTELCPVVYGEYAIVAIPRRVIDDANCNDIVKAESVTRVDINGGTYFGHLVYTCKDVAFLLLRGYKAPRGYDIASDNLFTALFTAANLSTANLANGIRMIPVNMMQMQHLF